MAEKVDAPNSKKAVQIHKFAHIPLITQKAAADTKQASAAIR